MPSRPPRSEARSAHPVVSFHAIPPLEDLVRALEVVKSSEEDTKVEELVARPDNVEPPRPPELGPLRRVPAPSNLFLDWKVDRIKRNI